MMRWTRLSLLYLVGYLTLDGLGLVVTPALALQFLGATGSYPPALVRFMGALLLALGILVSQIVRHRGEVLYPTTLVVRVVLVGTMVPLSLASRDPLFLVLTAIVGLGMVLTATQRFDTATYSSRGRIKCLRHASSSPYPPLFTGTALRVDRSLDAERLAGRDRSHSGSASQQVIEVRRGRRHADDRGGPRNPVPAPEAADEC